MSHARENERPEELTDVEQALAAFVPVPPQVDRDRLMFLAGAASVCAASTPTQAWDVAPGKPIGKPTLPARLLWPATSAALAATSLALAIALVTRPTPQAQVVYLDRLVPISSPSAATAATNRQPDVDSTSPTLASRQAPASVSADNYVRTRDVALRLGLDALGDWSGSGSESASPTPTYRSLLESLTPAHQRRPGATTESSQM